MAGADDYDRGHAAGAIAERLASHDKHFAAINGQLADIHKEMQKNRLELQRQGDRAAARAAVVDATALALLNAETARRQKTDQAENDRRAQADQSWSPWAKLLAVLGGMAAVAGVVAVLITQFQG